MLWLTLLVAVLGVNPGSAAAQASEDPAPAAGAASPGAIDPGSGSAEPLTDPLAAGGTRPNIVILLLDDLPGDVMPRLLRRLPSMRQLFARNGIRFPNFFVQDPLCCPGRASMLTGLTAGHHGVRVNWAPLLKPEETLATALDRVGYHNLLVGKYLNNSQVLKDKIPMGWDHAAIYGRGGYYDWELFSDGVRKRYGSRPMDYSTTVLRRTALRLLRQTPPRDPVFLLFSPSAVHSKRENGSVVASIPAASDIGSRSCAGIGYRKTPAYNESDMSDKPRWMRTIDYTQDPLYTPRGYALTPVCEALLSVDRAMDAFISELRRQDRFDDTIFILTADNGMGWGDHRWKAKSVPWATSVPFYVSWRSRLGVEPGVIDTWAQNIDIAPTLVEAAGASLGPYPTGQAAPDGVSLLDILLTRGTTSIPRTSLFEDRVEKGVPNLTWRGLRTTDQHPRGRWRYTEWATGARELYDLEADPWELENLARSRPKMRKAFHEELSELARLAND